MTAMMPDATTTGPAPAPGLHPRPEQVAALADLMRAFAVHDRAQVIMPCGTGKTLIGRWHAQAAGAGLTAVFAPSLGLVAQILGEWRRAGRGWPFDALIVCSDPTTAAGAAERADDDGADVDRLFWARAAASVTTDPARAAASIRRAARAGRTLAVFSTYHSAPVVAQAAAATGAMFDLVIADEAHHLAGRPREGFRAVLDARAIPARKRLFMTATPTIHEGAEVLSMDDRHLFGPVAHKVTFRQAIADGRLADYQVIVIAERAGGRRPDHRDDPVVPAALLDAASRHHLRSVLSFHTLVSDAAAFAGAMSGRRLPNGRMIAGRHISGMSPAAVRAHNLAWLAADTDGHQLRLIASARCLTEGIDVPAVDGIIFANPRKSAVSVIQATGRALRPAPGKTQATILIPVALPDGGDDDSELIASAFAPVWAVLRALRAHDERFAAELDEALADHAAGRRRGRLTRRVRFMLPMDLDEHAVQTRLIEATGAAWERFYALLAAYAAAHGTAMTKSSVTWQGAKIGDWAAHQRYARRDGLLAPSRIARLEELPGWAWDPSEGIWQRSAEQAERAAAAAGPAGLAQAPDGPSVFDGWKDALNLPLGHWAAEQRQLWRDDMLADDRADRLEKIPGWDWAGGLPGDDVAMIQALRLFCEFEHHPNVPEAHLENGLPLGRWAWQVRRRRLTGRLHPALAEEIAAATPRTARGEPTWQWEHAETQWRLGCSALRAYARRTGTAVGLPAGHVEQVDGADVAVYQWAALQRFKRRRGDLDPAHARWLEKIPGWEWEPPGRREEFGEPLDLGDPKWHGRAKAIQAGCKCDKCLPARRAYDAEYGRRRRAEQIPDPVPAGRAAARLARFEAAGRRRGLLAEASGVPLGVIRSVADGKTDVIRREHEARILALTDAAIAAVPTRVGSRGRVTTVGGERIDAAPTQALLDDLAARGLGTSWVARELGYQTSVFHYGGGSGANRITRRIAGQVADLHARAAGLSYPKAGNRRVPSLAELRAAQLG